MSRDRDRASDTFQIGATTVFDTDDDNLPSSKDFDFDSPTESFVVFDSKDAACRSININAHFDAPDIWPRGYPLTESRQTTSVYYLQSYGSLPEPARNVAAPPALIQQGLVMEPGKGSEKISYCQEYPTIRLVPGTFSPFYSQNTPFSYDALWGLLMPSTSKITNQNTEDFKHDRILTTNPARLTKFLTKWTSTSTDLETRIVELMDAMRVREFIGKANVDLAQRWIKDLKSVGYVFPKIVSVDALESCKSKEDPSNSEIRFEEEPQLDAFRDVLVAVNFNEGGLYDKVVPPYLDIYKKYFPNIVFYGPSVSDEYSRLVKVQDTFHGHYAYMALADAIEKNLGYVGYLHTNDDVILNPRQLAKFDKSRTQKDVWEDERTFMTEQLRRIANFTGVKGPVDIRAFVDAVYIPARLTRDFVPLMSRVHVNYGHGELNAGLGLVRSSRLRTWSTGRTSISGTTGVPKNGRGIAGATF
ncbi:MAG: hypothetical protein BYD32DRAFT_458527 [Podila humilis]|nr:MAG: hypothetical protein BYD32DRAFT_458527 [Podila humilis]